MFSFSHWMHVKSSHFIYRTNPAMWHGEDRKALPQRLRLWMTDLCLTKLAWLNLSKFLWIKVPKWKSRLTSPSALLPKFLSGSLILGPHLFSLHTLSNEGQNHWPWSQPWVNDQEGVSKTWEVNEGKDKLQVIRREIKEETMPITSQMS